MNGLDTPRNLFAEGQIYTGEVDLQLRRGAGLSAGLILAWRQRPGMAIIVQRHEGQ
jgi:hypothetical protein